VAQLTLTVAGYAIAGPYGGIIGGFIGGIVDRKWLFPQKVEGPRLGDLKIQISSYGQPIKEVWGTMRIAGNVIWADEIKEYDSSEGGGCFGGPEQISYSYSCSFAVGVCTGEIESISRIWADTECIYDARPPDYDTLPRPRDPDAPTGKAPRRGGVTIPEDLPDIYAGTETQGPDPTIEAVEGLGNVPGFRGLAYIVFKGFPLADYGNRIPNMTFEVIKHATFLCPVIAMPDTVVHSGNPDPPDTFGKKCILHVDGHTYMTPWFAIDTRTGLWRAFNEADPIDSPFDSGEVIDCDEAGMLYGLHYDHGTSTYHLVKFDVDLWQVVETGPAISPLDKPNMWGWFVVSKNPLYGYTWWTDNHTPSQVRVSTRGALGLYTSSFSVMDFSSVGISLDNETGTAWVLSTRTQGLRTSIMRITPNGPGTFDVDEWEVTANAPAGRQNNFITFDPTTNQVMIGTHSRDYGTSPDSDHLYFFDVSGGSPVYMGVLPDVNGLVLMYPGSAFQQGPINGKLYLPAGIGGDDITTYRYVRVDLATRTVDEEYYPAAYGSDFGYSYVYVPELHAIVNDWAYGYFDNPGIHEWYTLLLLDRVLGSGDMLGAIVGEISELAGLDATDVKVLALTDTVSGFVIDSRTTARSVIETLMLAYFFDAAEVDGKVVFLKRDRTVTVDIPESDLAVHIAGAERPQELVITRQQEAELPQTVEVNYVDPDFDYQTNMRYQRRSETTSQEKMLLQLPISLTGDEAREIATKHLAYAWLERSRFEISVPRKYAYLTPGDIVTVTEGGVTHTVYVENAFYESGIVRLALVRHAEV